FYTVGADGVGNVELPPAAADTHTNVDTVAPATPVVVAIPAFTPGTSRRVDWTGDGTAFEVEASTDAAFATIVSTSGWVAGPSYEFQGLADATKYYFRVHARDAAGNASAYAPALTTTQDASPPATAVLSLPAFSQTMQVSIAWSGADVASGIDHVDLYWSKDGGVSTRYNAASFTTSPIVLDALGAGGDGHYAFYVRGTDKVGNVEDAPSGADAGITIDPAAPGSPSLAAVPAFTAGNDLTLH